MGYKFCYFSTDIKQLASREINIKQIPYFWFEL